MKLIRLMVTAFRGVADGSYELADGFTVVRGPNEAGKSSFQQALLTVLFGDAASSAQKYNLLHSWQAGRKCGLTLTFFADGKDYELVRDFESGTSMLTPQDGGAVISGRDPVKKALATLTGLGSEDVYTATAFLRQQDLAKLQAGAELKDMLQQTMTGGDDEANASEILKKLEKEVSAVFTKGNRGGDKGRWLAAQAELEKLEERQAEIHADVETTVAARNTIAAHSDELEQKRDELDAAKALLERVQERNEREEEHDQLAGKCTKMQKRVEKARGLTQAIERREAELAELPPTDPQTAEDLKTVAARLSESRNQIADAEQEMAKLQQQADEITADREEAAAMAGKRPAATVAVITAAIVAALAVWQGITGLALAWALLAVALAGGGVALRILLQVAKHDLHGLDSRLAGLNGRIEQHRELVARLQAEEAQTQKTVAEALKQAGVETVAEYLEAAAAREQLARENEMDTRELGGLLGESSLGESSLADLDKELGEANLERKALADRLAKPEMLAAVMDAERMRELEGRIKTLDGEVKALDDDLRNARADLDRARYDVEDELRIEEQVAATRQRVARLDDYRKVLALAGEVLEEARQQTMRSTADQLGPTIEAYLSHLTNGRYDKVSMAHGDFQPVVFSARKSAFADPDEELSLGTREQVYLACRLALAKLLWPENGPPLLLDDPLVNADQARRLNGLELFSEIAESRQVVLFTCSGEYDEMADMVIELPSPA